MPEVSGIRTATILEAVDGAGLPLIRDILDNEYRYAPGTELTAAAAAADLGKTNAEIAATVGDDTVDNRRPGVRVAIFDVHFDPDRADAVPEDGVRLTQIAKLRKSVPDRTIRMVGYTVDVGNPIGQRALSAARAKAIVALLVQAGIPAVRFT